MRATLLRALETTIPADSPALILYEVFQDQMDSLESGLESLDACSKVELLPLALLGGLLPTLRAMRLNPAELLRDG